MSISVSFRFGDALIAAKLAEATGDTPRIVLSCSLVWCGSSFTSVDNGACRRFRSTRGGLASADAFRKCFRRVARFRPIRLSCLPACRSANAGSRPGMRAALASLLDAHGASQPVSGETPPQASPVLVSGLMTGDRHTPRVQSRPVRVLSPPRPSARSRTAPAVPATVPQCGRPILLQRGCAHRVADVPYTVSVRMLYPGRACGQPNT